MYNLLIPTVTCTIILVVLALFCIVWVSIRDIRKFKFQMEQMKVQSIVADKAKSNYVYNMSYSDLLDIVDKVINFYAADKVINLGLDGKSDEELSVILDDVLIEVCGKTKFSLSSQIKEALQFYVTEDFLDIYIKDTCRLTLVARTKLKGIGYSRK